MIGTFHLLRKMGRIFKPHKVRPPFMEEGYSNLGQRDGSSYKELESIECYKGLNKVSAIVFHGTASEFQVPIHDFVILTFSVPDV